MTALLFIMLLLSCNGPLPAPADPLVWRFGAPCTLDRPQDCGPLPLACAQLASETGQTFCAETCGAGAICPAVSHCQNALGLCLKDCETDTDCAPDAVCGNGACEPSCKVEPWTCRATCTREGRCVR